MVISTQPRQSSYPQRRSFSKLHEILEAPNLLQVQMDSYSWFQVEGLSMLLEEISPIQDFTG
ncbi:MAG: hypothetical protein QGI79_06325, partial [Dehalococcoidia bacterium]|nr:hypothetical protein [Dehalococcoidia bacterium]